MGNSLPKPNENEHYIYLQKSRGNIAIDVGKNFNPKEAMPMLLQGKVDENDWFKLLAVIDEHCKEFRNLPVWFLALYFMLFFCGFFVAATFGAAYLVLSIFLGMIPLLMGQACTVPHNTKVDDKIRQTVSKYHHWYGANIAYETYHTGFVKPKHSSTIRRLKFSTVVPAQQQQQQQGLPIATVIMAPAAQPLPY